MQQHAAILRQGEPLGIVEQSQTTGGVALGGHVRRPCHERLGDQARPSGPLQGRPFRIPFEEPKGFLKRVPGLHHATTTVQTLTS
ncbi:hypothetical protein GCM10010403_34390 [Glycomyces rutgersensis]|uniref:Uncharacterized protein n=1 Tax=Glycomyces rutgersensis TaxID=58115 RepID=A0ABN3FW94_9ACTN